MAALFGAQDIARATDLQVAHGDLETGPEVGVLLDRLEPFCGVGGDAPLGVEQQVGIGSMFVPADPAAELVQVRQSVTIRIIDENGVGVRYIEAAFDDGSGDQDVRAVPYEVEHGLFQLVLVHLAVGDEDARLGDDLLELAGDELNGVDAVVHEENLAVSIEFTDDGVPNQYGIEPGDSSLDGEAVVRWGFQVGDVADSEQRQVQGAWDGGGGEREHVDGAAQGLEPLLVRDPEPLLFVDNHQAEVMEGHGLLHQAMGA